jgi:hypothetical protein
MARTVMTGIRRPGGWEELLHADAGDDVGFVFRLGVHSGTTTRLGPLEFFLPSLMLTKLISFETSQLYCVSSSSITTCLVHLLFEARLPFIATRLPIRLSSGCLPAWRFYQLDASMQLKTMYVFPALSTL